MKAILKIRPVYIVIVLLLFIIFLYFFYFAAIENYMQDTFLQSSKLDSRADMRIAIIGIDGKSLEELGRWQDWKRNYYADMINILAKGEPAAIGVDIFFSERGEDEQYDKALTEAVKNAKNVVLAAYGDFGNRLVQDVSSQAWKAVDLEAPFDELAEVSSFGSVNVVPDQDDNVVRSFLNTIQYGNKKIDSFDSLLYHEYLRNTRQSVQRTTAPKDYDGSTYIDYIARPGKEFEVVPFYQVLNGEVPPDYFKDRIVLIGPYAAAVADDSYLTPMDRQVKMYGVEIHANIVQNFLSNTFKVHAPDWINLLILIAFAGAGFALFKVLGPLKSAIAVIVIIVAYIFTAQFVYGIGIILSLFYPIFILVMTYLTILIFRYMQELMERRRITGIFSRYVAPQVVKEIIKNGEDGLKLGGLRREITTLFVDIRGFTTMSEKCQPEEVVEILNAYLNLCAESIFKFGGTLDKFIGDASMAIFNAPLSLEDHPFKAVQTAWEMKQGSEVLRTELEKKFGRSVQFGIGINTGFAVVGNIGSKARMDYTAIGDTVNTAARLESNARPGQILLSQATYELVRDRVIAEPLGEIKVKGKEQGISVYQLNGLKEAVREAECLKG
jgi:adenylate cyclase